MNNIKDALAKIMIDNGYNINLQNSIEELFFDSLQFITTIIDIEDSFEVEIPESYLTATMLNTFQDYCDMVCAVLDETKGSN